MIHLYQLAFETSKIQYAFTYMVQKSAPSHLMKYCVLMAVLFEYITICDVLRDLVPFVQFKKREKHPWRAVTFSKVAGF